MRIIGKVIAAKIVERDLSEVVNNDELTTEELIDEITERYKYEDDKSEMHEVLEEVLSSRK